MTWPTTWPHWKPTRSAGSPPGCASTARGDPGAAARASRSARGPARRRQPVLIPGSMGTASYVLAGVPGGGAFASACHGAGRRMSRHQAARAVTGPELRQQLERQGIAVRGASARGLAEEAPQAYKDINQVVDAAEGAGLCRQGPWSRLRPRRSSVLPRLTGTPSGAATAGRSAAPPMAVGRGSRYRCPAGRCSGCVLPAHGKELWPDAAAIRDVRPCPPACSTCARLPGPNPAGASRRPGQFRQPGPCSAWLPRITAGVQAGPLRRFAAG